MSREEAIDLLDNLIGMVDDNHDNDYDTALKMGIQALEYDDAKYHEEHGEVIVDKAVWEDAKRALEQEPAYCDRNICLRNEYNGIGCDKCEVTKSQEPSGDAVSRQAALDLAKFDERKGLGTIIHAFDVEQLPSVKPLEKMGHWKRISMDKYTTHAQYWYRCDRCGKDNLGNTDWCPNCGCRMVEPQESEVS